MATDLVRLLTHFPRGLWGLRSGTATEYQEEHMVCGVGTLSYRQNKHKPKACLISECIITGAPPRFVPFAVFIYFSIHVCAHNITSMSTLYFPIKSFWCVTVSAGPFIIFATGHPVHSSCDCSCS